LEEARLRAQKMAKKFKLPIEVKIASDGKEVHRKHLTLG
ncbi:MAG: hypothetical protein JWO58_593, partial [Chitinophagaceae bacterium]|nr:hypothetical protein [Chitinophagaceae bacterium]